MSLGPHDWAIVAAYLLFSFGVGAWLARRAHQSTSEYFKAGATLPWWLVGTSMVATTFAADTPLLITEFVRQDGVWGNWFWWNLAIGHVLAAFVFARLWQRAGVLTDLELTELRYSGRSAALLRGLKAAYFALLLNLIVLGWVLNAMGTVLEVLLAGSVDPGVALLGCAALALAYSLLAGFWGVVVTDLLQFVLASLGALLLAVLACEQLGGLEAVIAAASQAVDNPGLTALFPPAPTPETSFWDARTTQFGVYVAVMWWASHRADGGGYIIQRMLSARDERHSVLATLWFCVCHYALRVWPWVIVALASLALFPELSNPKLGYPMVMVEVLPAGLKGLLLASFLAAFMSTVDTHLNWGASYLVHDIYRRFVRPDVSEKHALLAAKLAMVWMLLMGVAVAVHVDSLGRAWGFLWALGAGLGPVLIARWFWWRLNAWSEIAAMASSCVVGAITFSMGLPTFQAILLVVPISLIVTGLATWLTAPVEKAQLLRFVRQVRPGGAWGPVLDGEPLGDGLLNRVVLLDVCVGLALVYGLTFGIGDLLLGRSGRGLLFTGMALTAGFFLYRRYRPLDSCSTPTS